MLTPELEKLIQYALEDGELTDKERSVLMRKAQDAGVDLDEFEMILDAEYHKVKKSSTPPKNAQKTNSKYGEIRKCPACGAMVSSFTAKCSECGFEFSNVEAVRSAQTLFEKLQALEMEKARELAAHDVAKNKQLHELSLQHNSGGAIKQIANVMSSKRQNEERDDLVRTLEKDVRNIERKYLDAKINLIKVFAVPNTKEDLMELLSMASSGAYDNDGVIGPEEEVWLQKADQIYQKLVVCAAGDQVTLSQATSMVVSLIKRLPKKYKNFTRIPKDLRDKINVELKAEKAERNQELFTSLKNILYGWRGITLVVSLLLTLVFPFFIIVFIVVAVMSLKAYMDEKKDILY